jgi:hypothetical protein
MSKVVALPGYSVPTPHGEPVANIVAIFEEYLEQAKAGIVVGAAVAVVMKRDLSGESIESDFCASAGQAWHLDAAIGRMVRRFAKAIDGDGEICTRPSGNGAA